MPDDPEDPDARRRADRRGWELLRPARADDGADSLAARRAALRDRYRWALTADEAVIHRRLINSGRVAEARALVDQAERFFLTARNTVALMNIDELAAFEQALSEDDGPRRYRVVASALRRVGREAWQQAAMPMLTAGVEGDDGGGGGAG